MIESAADLEPALLGQDDARRRIDVDDERRALSPALAAVQLQGIVGGQPVRLRIDEASQLLPLIADDRRGQRDRGGTGAGEADPGRLRG